jgi:hypothetical protein
MGAATFLMLLYLDDDSVRAILIRRLTAEGHDVLIPADTGIAGQDDATHLMCAIRTGRALLTHPQAQEFRALAEFAHHRGGKSATDLVFAGE